MAVQQTLDAPVPPAQSAAASAEREKNRNLVQRLLTAIIGIPISLAFICAGGLYFTVFMGVICVLVTLELSAIALGRSPLRWLAVAAAFAFPFFFSVSALGPVSIQWLWAGLVVAALSMRLVLGAPLDHAAGEVMACVFAGIYGSLAGYLVPLRNLGPTMSWTGSGWVILVCALSWMSDTGAYFAGRFLGRHKLAPDISPSKTWEGFFGGMAAAIGAAFFTQLVALHTLTALDCVILGVVAGVAGPAGDLAESMIKRSYHVKDSGHLLPGHGGMMDRVDAMVFNALAVYAYYHLACAGRISV